MSKLYSKCGQNGHAGKMAPSVYILDWYLNVLVIVISNFCFTRHLDQLMALFYLLPVSPQFCWCLQQALVMTFRSSGQGSRLGQRLWGFILPTPAKGQQIYAEISYTVIRSAPLMCLFRKMSKIPCTCDTHIKTLGAFTTRLKVDLLDLI